MQVVEKHGGLSHYVRPDRVYRTSVIVPTGSYNPGPDVQAITASFTERPMDLQLPQGLSGLRGLRDAAVETAAAADAADAAATDAAAVAATVAHAADPSLVNKVKMWWRNLMARWQSAGRPQAAMFMVRDPRIAGQQIYNPHQYGMAYAQIGMQVAPQMMSSVAMLAELNRGSLPPAVAQAQVATTMERWYNQRWNG